MNTFSIFLIMTVANYIQYIERMPNMEECLRSAQGQTQHWQDPNTPRTYLMNGKLYPGSAIKFKCLKRMSNLPEPSENSLDLSGDIHK